MVTGPTLPLVCCSGVISSRLNMRMSESKAEVVIRRPWLDHWERSERSREIAVARAAAMEIPSALGMVHWC